MSLLLRDELRIALNPEHVTLERLGRGFRPAVKDRQVVPCTAPLRDEAPWAKALESLESGLARLNREKLGAQVVLSNHFVRYALLPWNDQISDQREEQAFIRHCFARTYGEEAQRWVFRLSPCGYGKTRVACAIDQGLLDGLDRITSAHGVRVVSLQPAFMAAFNQWRRQIRDSVAWFVVAEPGRLCLSLLQQGSWCNLRTMKTGTDWQQALRKLLEREFLVSGTGTERGTVYLFAPGMGPEVDLPDWNVRQLGSTSTGARVDIADLALNMSE